MYILSYGSYLLSNHKSFCLSFSLFFLSNRYIPGYLKELQDGHAEELQLFKKQLYDVKLKMVNALAILF